MSLLEVRDLATHLFLDRGVLRAVDGVSFDLEPGRVLGLIGESGSGKTMTGLSILGMPPRPVGRIVAGSVLLDGRELVGLDETTLAREVRGRQVAMISQDPMTSLNPVFPVGEQVAAPLRAHGFARGRAAIGAAIAERLYTIGGSPPDPLELPGGCAFHPRCPDVMAVCRVEEPPETDLGDGRTARCWLQEEAP